MTKWLVIALVCFIIYRVMSYKDRKAKKAAAFRDFVIRMSRQGRFVDSNYNSLTVNSVNGIDDGIDGIDVSQLNEILANRSYVLRWHNDTLSIERRSIDVEISEIND